MRIFTLLGGPSAIGEAERLSTAVRAFNAGVDFRLRFLHIEIDEMHATPASAQAELAARVARAQITAIPDRGALFAAAALGLAIAEARPDLVVVVGHGELAEPGVAAAAAAGYRLALFGHGRRPAHGAVDLGEDPEQALETMQTLVREIQK
ncbi:MAG: hypothetical protein ACT4PV_10680 [Planctomycetaceae bacterium]